jgi:hypothetical protein
MRISFSPDVAREGLKGSSIEELEDMLISALERADALEEAIYDALLPGRYGWELLDAEDMAERLTDTYDPFGQTEPDAYVEMQRAEHARLVAWNAGEPIRA